MGHSIAAARALKSSLLRTAGGKGPEVCANSILAGLMRLSFKHAGRWSNGFSLTRSRNDGWKIHTTAKARGTFCGFEATEGWCGWVSSHTLRGSNLGSGNLGHAEHEL